MTGKPCTITSNFWRTRAVDEKQFEHAEFLAEQERQAGIKRAQHALIPEKDQRYLNGDKMFPDFDDHCIICGEEIPEGRLVLGKVRCIICQQRKEHRDRGL